LNLVYKVVSLLWERLFLCKKIKNQEVIMETLHHQCPLCKGEFNPLDGMNPQNHLAKGVIETYRGMQEKNDGGNVPPCPRCGKPMNPWLDDNAQSRHEDIYICEECGEDEAMREQNNDILPVSEWKAVNDILGILE